MSQFNTLNGVSQISLMLKIFSFSVSLVERFLALLMCVCVCVCGGKYSYLLSLIFDGHKVIVVRHQLETNSLQQNNLCC